MTGTLDQRPRPRKYLRRAGERYRQPCPQCGRADRVEAWWETDGQGGRRVRVCCMRCAITGILAGGKRK
jgi:hypothetical protein